MKAVAAELLTRDPSLGRRHADLQAGRLMKSLKHAVPVGQFSHSLRYFLDRAVAQFHAELPGAAVAIIEWEDKI
jgi:hypothetical protein